MISSSISAKCITTQLSTNIQFSRPIYSVNPRTTTKSSTSPRSTPPSFKIKTRSSQQLAPLYNCHPSNHSLAPTKVSSTLPKPSLCHTKHSSRQRQKNLACRARIPAGISQLPSRRDKTRSRVRTIPRTFTRIARFQQTRKKKEKIDT